MREWTWDGVEDPFSGFIRDARQEAGHLRIGMSQWRGMSWRFWVYTTDGLMEVLPGDTVVLQDDATITITRGATDGV